MALNPRLYGDIGRNDNHGHCKDALNEDFDYHSKKQASIEVYGTDQINIWSAKHAHLPIDKYEFGANCCDGANLQYL